MIDKLKKIPSKKLKLLSDLQYKEDEVTVDTRRSNTVNTAKANLDARLKDFHAKQAAKSYYSIPLKFLTDFGQIDEIVEQNIKIVFNLENDMRKLFERNGTVATNPHKAPSAYTFHASPYIIAPIFNTTMYYKHFKSEGLKSTKSYRFGITNVYTTRTYEMPAGISQENIDFNNVNKQFDWLEIYLMPKNSVNHISPFDTYGRNFITSKVSTLEIANIGTSYATTKLDFNLTKHKDKLMLYNNFLAFMTDSCSLNDCTGYVNSAIAENLPSIDEYFSANMNFPLYYRSSLIVRLCSVIGTSELQ